MLGRHVLGKESLNKPVKIHFRWKVMKTTVSLKKHISHLIQDRNDVFIKALG